MVLPSNDATKSYWIEAAESPLRNHRSSEQLPAETDIAIIGSGYAGVSTAYWIHKYSEKAPRQPKVTILEARDVCGGATGRNGGQLRPHAYSRYPVWRERFGPNGAMALIKHEMAHLAAFKELAQEEGITEEVCLQLGETFDAAMTEEAWARLSNALHEMRTDHGDDDEVVRVCRAIEDAAKAEEFTQMKGVLGAIVHPAGSIWPYKFVHALLRKLLETGKVDLHANTPVTAVSERNADGWITVTTPRGTVRARTVVHTTNRWAPHLLPEFNKIILPQVGTIAAIKAPPKFIKHTGAQHWDSSVNNYHIQLPPPHNIIILGGARQLLVHNPETGIFNDNEDKQLQGVSEFYKTWPASDVKDWPGPKVAEFGKADNEGGVWTGLHDTTADNFPFVGPLPSHRGQFINAGFNGHGMPRILLSSAYIAPLALDAIGFVFRQPRLAASFPPLPQPFHVTPERVAKLQNTDVDSIYKAYKEQCQLSAKKPFCNTDRVKVAKTRPNL